jgi:hypothetical protein
MPDGAKNEVYGAGRAMGAACHALRPYVAV